jgi:putative flavoprotein involved in K+ transport
MPHVDVAVIGAGQAGLAVGYFLARHRMRFVILDGASAVGDSWRRRWDSLRLFTPARCNNLPGLPFPGAPDDLPGKDDVVRYLTDYAAHWELPLQLDTHVMSVRRPHAGGAFRLETSVGEYEADQVILATGPFHTPRVPPFAGGFSGDVVQLHSSAYRNPEQLPDGGDIVIVGGGNSGVQIASELARQRRTWLSIGTALKRLPQHVLGRSLFWWLDTSGFMNVTVDSRLGRRARTREFLIGDSPADVARRDGVMLTGRALAASGTTLRTADHTLDLRAVIWATGFTPDFGILDPAWLDVACGLPQHRGVTDVPGLYVVGVPWLYTRGSALLGWVHRDAQYVVAHVAGRTRRSNGLPDASRPWDPPLATAPLTPGASEDTRQQ